MQNLECLANAIQNYPDQALTDFTSGYAIAPSTTNNPAALMQMQDLCMNEIIRRLERRLTGIIPLGTEDVLTSITTNNFDLTPERIATVIHHHIDSTASQFACPRTADTNLAMIRALQTISRDERLDTRIVQSATSVLYRHNWLDVALT